MDSLRDLHKKMDQRWPFAESLSSAGLRRGERISTLQVNLGKKCNQACLHCHVEAGPKRTEMMSEETFSLLIELLGKSPDLVTLDITGGAPEMHPLFRELVREGRRLGLEVIDRCNLSICLEKGQEDLAEFLAGNDVHIIASLPCYSELRVDAQRGKGVFGKSIRALQELNALGYGKREELVLDLVYNPGGAFLPPKQQELEKEYRKKLYEDFSISFSNLFTLTNMPIKRFAASLVRDGKLEEYMELLRHSFNPETVEGLMCRTQLSVGWDGSIYDCDFNQMLELAARKGPLSRPQDLAHLVEEGIKSLAKSPIAVGAHCYGCTAGAGSSCGGALSE